jgi:small-conductance mechanosensitive channel
MREKPMSKERSNRRWFLCLPTIAAITCAAVISLPVFETTLAAASPQAVAAARKSKGDKASADKVQLPENIDAKDIDKYMAALSDEQVRRLLIEALKKQADEEAAASKTAQNAGRLVGFIKSSKELLERLKERIAFLQSGATAAPAKVSPIFTYLGAGTGDKESRPERTIISVMAVFAAAFVIVLLFRFLTTGARGRLEAAPGIKMTTRLGASIGLALLSIAGMVIFSGATLTFYYIFLNRSEPQRVLVATYLVAILSVWAVAVVSKLFLAPHKDNLRFLPVTGETAVYIHRWVVAIAAVTSFGSLTCGIIRLAGASAADHFKSLLLVGIIAAGMLIWMIIGRRKQVAASLLENRAPNSLRASLGRSWHIFAILGVILLLIVSTINGLIEETPQFIGVKTLLLIPLYLLLDWGLRQILDVSFGLAQRPDELKEAFSASGTGEKPEQVEFEDTLSASVKEDFSEGSQGKAIGSSVGGETEAEEDRDTTHAAEGLKAAADASAAKADESSFRVNLQRMQRVIRIGLRAALATWVAFWVLSIWGINLPIGERVSEAVFNILVVVIIGYVGWEIISAAIQRRLQQEMPEDDEDREEGGAGGSRLGTLLLILRKFVLIVIVIIVTLITLSSVGVDIAPLIAGAGVIGLAIGFGAQTLVKDIISGMFFLVDDAFRVGDYVVTGSQKGTVEHISLRSLRLRHPRGMVYTIPFSDISSVTNFSRDYIITKLDFRVPFGTDVEQVRKLVKKKVNQVIMADPELGGKLLGPIKSQGVREMDDDSALIVRVKYKTPPGEQFAIRKQVYRLMQEAFQEAGLSFAPRNVTVSLPPEVKESLARTDAETREKILEASTAAAGAVIQAEEAQKAK